MEKNTFGRFVMVCAVLFTVLFNVVAQHEVALSHGWQFVRCDLGGVWEAVRVPQAGQPTNFPMWQEVEVPHCFNATDAVDPDGKYYQGPAWYRIRIADENPYPDGRTFLRFGGVGQKAEVYVGMHKAGAHVGGYDEWEVDITDALALARADKYLVKNYAGKIPVSVRCDNSRDLEMIPSNLSDFTLYGGLYRPVALVYRPENWVAHVKVLADVDAKGQKGTIELLPVGGRLQIAPSYRVTLLDGAGKVVLKQDYPAGAAAIRFAVPRPFLWSPSSPHLYTLQVEALWDSYTQVVTQRVGFRHFEFQKNGPFVLNGQRLLLKGTHRHEDFANAGAAETQGMLLAEMRMIKEMGANFIRLGHYQQSRRVLELCDSLGLLVWEEIPWCRGGLGGETYQQQARRMLRHMIEQHGNHPSVILWGLGNENDWPGDFVAFEPDSIRTFMAQLHQLAHQLDPSRMTAIRRCDFCKDIVDVYSPSIWPGWYRGRYNDYARVTKFEMRQTDRFLHVEWGADSHVGRHSEPRPNEKPVQPEDVPNATSVMQLYSAGKNMSREGDWSETYAAELFDWTLTSQRQMPWLTGTAFWTFKDFATPIRPENPIPYVNQKGVVQRDLVPKEVYYVVQAHWSDKPMVHIYGHSWPVRWGGRGDASQIKVYSNCPEVELFVNGQSQGAKKRQADAFPAMGLVWDVVLREGENHIKAVARTKGPLLTDEVTQTYQVGPWGPVERLVLREIPLDARTSYLEATAVDAQGKVCVDARNRVRFDVTGEARLLKMQGTATGSQLIELANGKARIKLLKSGSTFAASVHADGIGTFMYIPQQSEPINNSTK